MPRLFRSHRAATAVVLACLIAGCGRTSSTLPTDQADGGGHSHDLTHGQVGPHGGHLVELGDGQYHAEWLHEDETGRITLIILDDKPEDEVAIAAKQVLVDIGVGGRRKSYPLEAVHTAEEEEKMKTSRFEIVSEELLVALKVGEGVSAILRVDVGGKTLTGQIEHHAHEDDGHGHHH
jgi:hypothetical protein